ncbi:hypothetical protein ACLI4Z_17170 [Natrialbaceae archaeon A-arb3/5]
MSSPPPETETHEVTLSRAEQWVAHHVLANRVDDALDADESPPAWAVSLVETIESDETNALTRQQLAELADELTHYLDREETPQQDAVHGSAVLERLEDALESP